SIPLPVVVKNDSGPGERHLENTLTATLEAADLGLGEIPPSGTWKLYAAAGLWEDGAWRRPGGPSVPAPYDLAFVANESFSGTQSSVQAGILASGDLSAAAGVLDFEKLPDFTPPVATGRQTRIYRSKFDIGEGRETFVLRPVGGFEGTVAVPIGENLLGLYVPYAVWITADYESLKPIPLFFEMHGFGGDHLGLGGWASGTIDVPAMAFSPNGRSGYNLFHREGELDVMEGFEDILAHYDVDEDRVYVSGISAGGFGTYWIATRYPDRFAAAIPLIGTGASEEANYPPPVAEGSVGAPLQQQLRERRARDARECPQRSLSEVQRSGRLAREPLLLLRRRPPLRAARATTTSTAASRSATTRS
ncbi:MAG: prolyl oligopeptidase family serine peptidase, partial [Candidatus Binatia bacterium]